MAIRKRGYIAGIASLMGLAPFVVFSAGPGSDTGTSAASMVRAASPAQVELRMPIMNPVRGRELFASKGCVVCHSVNGVGGTDAPKLDDATITRQSSPFDFMARMWIAAPNMIAMQKSELGHQIHFTGDELADIMAFVHDAAEREKFTSADIPENIRELMEDDADEDE